MRDDAPRTLTHYEMVREITIIVENELSFDAEKFEGLAGSLAIFISLHERYRQNVIYYIFPNLPFVRFQFLIEDCLVEWFVHPLPPWVLLQALTPCCI